MIINHQQKTQFPLVSVIVGTYNSSRFVIETLESIKAQTYVNIELIISDDCSADNTVALCENWLNENDNRFLGSKILTSENNSGIPANCNRGVKAARGDWVKLIAGDDFISNKYLMECMNDCINDEQTGIIYTNSVYVDEHSCEITRAATINYSSGFVFDKIFFLLFWPKSSSLIFRKKAVEEVGYFDESIWVEDYLMVMKVVKKYKMCHVNSFLSYQRNHEKNIGGASIRLYQAHLQAIEHFKDYPGYNKRRQQIYIELLALALFEKPSVMVKLINDNPSILLRGSLYKKITRKLLTSIGIKRVLK